MSWQAARSGSGLIIYDCPLGQLLCEAIGKYVKEFAFSVIYSWKRLEAVPDY